MDKIEMNELPLIVVLYVPADKYNDSTSAEVQTRLVEAVADSLLLLQTELKQVDERIYIAVAPENVMETMKIRKGRLG